MAASTDANAAYVLGIPSLSLGVSFGKGMHTEGEEISISSLNTGRLQIGNVINDLLAA